MPDFGTLPPEINSGLMYAGPGAGPMLAAAAAWGELATQLFSTATACESVVAELATGWQGPSALSMTAAAAPYGTWLRHTAAVAEQAAVQAKSAAAAYESAFAMTVPPPVVAANRTLLATLVSTNFFGQNTAAIAATESRYAQMWLQDAVAMYTYSESAVACCRMAPFTAPPGAGDASSLAGQSGAAAQGLVAPSAADPLPASTLLLTGLSATKVVNTVMSTTSSAVSGRGLLIVNERLAAAAVDSDEQQAFNRLLLPKTSPTGGRRASTTSVVTGRATSIGKLSVPANWATIAPEIRLAAPTLPISEAFPTGTQIQPPISGSVFSQSVLGTLSRDGPDKPRPKSKPIIVRSPAAG